MKKILAVLFLFSSAVTQAMPTIGSLVSGAIDENTEVGKTIVPLPSGKWTVVYAGQFEGPRMQRAGTDITGYNGESSNKFEEIVLVQEMGSNLESMIDVKFNITNELKTYADNLCTNNPAYFKDDYGTRLWRQRCLEVGSAINAIDSDNSPKGRAIRAFIATHSLLTPKTFVAMNYGQYGRDGSRIDVRLNVNPVAQNLDDQSDISGLSQWHHEVIAKYPQKLQFMSQFAEFAKSYAHEINKQFR